MFKTVIDTSASPATIKMIGDLDTSASDSFVSDISGLLDKSCDSVIIDMSQLDFISSSGLRKLLIAKKMVASKGGEMSVINIKPAIRQIFSLTCFDSLLGIK